jgi:hypothetical protein
MVVAEEVAGTVIAADTANANKLFFIMIILKKYSLN